MGCPSGYETPAKALEGLEERMDAMETLLGEIYKLIDTFMKESFDPGMWEDD